MLIKDEINLPHNKGIYRIVNLSNQKAYYGSAVNFTKRFNYHKRKLKANKHPNQYLQHAFNLNQELKFEIVEPVSEEFLLISKEQTWKKLPKPAAD